MNTIDIQIKYSDKFGDNAGCTTIRLPAWLEQAPLPKIKGFFKLAAKNTRDPENHGEVVRLEAYLTKAIEEAEAAVKTAKSLIATPEERAAEVRRAENWLKRLRKIQADLTAALDKYSPKRKND